MSQKEYLARYHASVRTRRESTYALWAFGHAIATVARAQMIARVAIGRTIRVDMDEPHAERGLELWQRGASLLAEVGL